MGGDYDDSTRDHANRVGSSRPRSSAKSEMPDSAREKGEGGGERRNKKIRKLDDVHEDGKEISLEVSTDSNAGAKAKIYFRKQAAGVGGKKVGVMMKMMRKEMLEERRGRCPMLLVEAIKTKVNR